MFKFLFMIITNPLGLPIRLLPHGSKNGGDRMFDTEQLKSIDSRYFNIITVDEYDVTIQSRNTGITGTCIVPASRVMRRVSSSTSINIAILITSTGVETASDGRFGAYRVMTGGR